MPTRALARYTGPALVAAGAVLIASAGVILWRKSVVAHTRKNAPIVSAATDPDELHVPRYAAVNLDGDADDWGSAGARTGLFHTAEGKDANPNTQIRAVWADGYLYLLLYAADEDIEVGPAGPDEALWLKDAFQLTFTSPNGDERHIDLSPTGTVTDAIKRKGEEKLDFSWQSGLKVSTEKDGTVNKPEDMDEEWVLEVAIPFESLGIPGQHGDRLGFFAKRCDKPKKSARVCAEATQRSLVLE